MSKVTTVEKLENKVVIFDNFDNMDAFELSKASIFKIKGYKELEDKAAVLMTVRRICGSANFLGEYIGTTNDGSLFIVSYKNLAKLDSLPDAKEIIFKRIENS